MPGLLCLGASGRGGWSGLVVFLVSVRVLLRSGSLVEWIGCLHGIEVSAERPWWLHRLLPNWCFFLEWYFLLFFGSSLACVSVLTVSSTDDLCACVVTGNGVVRGCN